MPICPLLCSPCRDEVFFFLSRLFFFSSSTSYTTYCASRLHVSHHHPEVLQCRKWNVYKEWKRKKKKGIDDVSDDLLTEKESNEIATRFNNKHWNSAFIWEASSLLSCRTAWCCWRWSSLSLSLSTTSMSIECMCGHSGAAAPGPPPPPLESVPAMISARAHTTRQENLSVVILLELPLTKRAEQSSASVKQSQMGYSKPTSFQSIPIALAIPSKCCCFSHFICNQVI